jgi:hypothetical protein
MNIDKLVKVGLLSLISGVIYFYLENSDKVNRILKSVSKSEGSSRRFGVFLSINIVKLGMLLLTIISSLFFIYMIYKRMKK